MVSNKGLIYKNVLADGYPVPGKHLVVESRPFDLERELPSRSIITKNFYSSMDPYQRVLMKDPSDSSYKAGFPLGKPITGRVVAEVVRSSVDSKFQKGDLIKGVLPIEEYTLLSADEQNDLERIHNPLDLDLKHFVSTLDWSGLTAYSSFYDIGRPSKGESILISGAAGAVGMIVGQLAKREGLKVFGSAGSDEKVRFLVDELGWDGAFNYKNAAESFMQAIARLAPDGLDIFYDNVGGEQLDFALLNMKLFGRIGEFARAFFSTICFVYQGEQQMVITCGHERLTAETVNCGMISKYNAKPEDQYRFGNLIEVIFRRLTMRGFQTTDASMGGKYAAEHQENFQKWIKDGILKTPMMVVEPFDLAADGFLGMLKGRNNGKAIVKISDSETAS